MNTDKKDLAASFMSFDKKTVFIRVYTCTCALVQVSVVNLDSRLEQS